MADTDNRPIIGAPLTDIHVYVNVVLPRQGCCGLLECGFLLVSVSFARFLGQLMQQTVSTRDVGNLKHRSAAARNHRRIRAVQPEWSSFDLAPRHQRRRAHACIQIHTAQRKGQKGYILCARGNPSQSYGASPATRDHTALPATRHWRTRPVRQAST